MRFARAAAAIGVLDSASIVIVGRDRIYNEDKVTKFVDNLGADLPELSLIAGVFCNADVSGKKKSAPDLSAQHAVEFARFAASDHALTSSDRIAHFNYDTALRILNAQRESPHLSQAQADFDKLRSLGVESASLFNMGGLILASQKKNEQAAELFEKAASLEDVTVFKSNFATVAKTPGQMERALKLLAGVEDTDIEGLLKTHEYGYFSYAKLLAHAKLEKLPTFDPERFARIGPRALGLKEYEGWSARGLIERALVTT